MKNKLSLFAVPYVGWMSIFVVAPIIIMVVYAFSTAAGDFTLENFARMGTYTAVFTRSFKLAIIATLIALLIGYPVSYMLSKEAADLFLDVHSGEQRTFEPAVSADRPDRPLQPGRHALRS